VSLQQSYAAPSRNSAARQIKEREPLAEAIDALRRGVEGTSSTSIHTGTLQAEVTRYVQQRKGYNDAIAQDWLSGATYTDKRRRELAALPGGEIPAAQFGLSITMEQFHLETFAPRLRFTHEGSGGYYRMTPSTSLADKCKALYEAKHGKIAPGLDVIFVNSKYAAKKLSARLGVTTLLPQPYGTSAYPPQPMLGARLRIQSVLRVKSNSYTELYPGLFVVTFGPSHSKKEMEDRLIRIGARVSPYLIERALRQDCPLPISAPNVDNMVALAKFKKMVAGSLVDLAALPDQHPASAQGGVIVSLVEDLQVMLQHNGVLKRHRNDPVVRSALEALGNQLQTIPTQQHDNQRFSNVYMAVMEELKVILSAVRPYDQAAYKAAATAQLFEQLDSSTRVQLSHVRVSSCITTSGISAIDQGLEAARELSGKNEIDILRNSTGRASPVYFELHGLLKENGTAYQPGASTLYATLNPNTLAQDDWGGGKAIADAVRPHLSNRDRKQPLTLVLDRTVERREDMPALMKDLAPAIAAGHLRVLLCKSHQKFSSMGSAKVAAGNVTLLAAPDKKTAAAIGTLEKNERDLEWMAADERQLMTHFLRSGKQEYALFDKAVANANFLRRQCFSNPDHTRLIDFSERLPFLQTSMYDNKNSRTHWPSFRVKPKEPGAPEESIEMPPTVALPQALIHCRGSFGLPTTNFITIPGLPGYVGGAFRFSLGQESKAELIEHFYMFTRVMRLGSGPLDCATICAHIETLIDQGLSPIQKRGEGQMSLAHKMAAIGRNEAPILNDQERLYGSVAEMRATLKRDRDDQPFTLNKIVSTLGILEIIADWVPIKVETSRERPQLDAMLENVIKSGMPGVSATGRNLIFRLQARLSHADLHSKSVETRGKAMDSLIATMERAPATRLYFMATCKIPNAAMVEQRPSQQQKLVELLFRPLPTDAKVAFLQRHQQISGYDQFAAACAQSIDNGDASISSPSPQSRQMPVLATQLST
jgi:hypothetical protein